MKSPQCRFGLAHWLQFYMAEHIGAIVFSQHKFSHRQHSWSPERYFVLAVDASITILTAIFFTSLYRVVCYTVKRGKEESACHKIGRFSILLPLFLDPQAPSLSNGEGICNPAPIVAHPMPKAWRSKTPLLICQFISALFFYHLRDNLVLG